MCRPWNLLASVGIALEATIPAKRGPDLGIDPSAEAAIFCDEAIHPASPRRSAFGEASAPDLPDTTPPNRRFRGSESRKSCSIPSFEEHVAVLLGVVNSLR